MARKIPFLATAALALAGGAQQVLAQDAIVGILEEQPSETGAKPTPFVRTVFKKADGVWTAYDPACPASSCFPRATSWTVGFDGKPVGQVLGVTPRGWKSMSDVGRQSLPPGTRAPFVGQRSNRFAGWSGGPVFRPLVSTSTGHVADPEGWKAAAVPAPIDTALRQRIRAKFPTAARCVSAEGNVPAPWVYADKDLVVDGAYASAEGWRIARVGLKAEDYRCDGPIDTSGESAFSPLTVAIAPDGTMTDLGFDMQLLDGGDYDADGTSELVFMYTRYNAEGYKLFSDNFAEHATFGFSFH